MRKISLIALPLVIGTAIDAQAYETAARVVKVVPIQQTVNRPVQQCRTEYQQQVLPAERDSGGAILGTIIGGVIGHQIGDGRGKTIATAAGAAAGAVIGDRAANRDAQGQVVSTPVQRCEMVNHYETQISGYRVTYELNG